MKISSDYVKSFRAIQNRLRREYPRLKDKDFETLPENLTEILILCILATNENFSRAKQAMKSLQNMVVDFNELRVTPAAEIVEMLEDHISDAQKVSTDIIKTLNWVFTRFDTLELSELKQKTKTEITRLFEDIPCGHEHARCALLLLGFDVPAMPLDDRMLEFLVMAEALPAEVDLATARGFIERNLKAAELNTFYWQLRKATEAEDKKRKPKGKKD